MLIRFGSLQAVYATAFFINAVLVWLLWLHNAPDDDTASAPAPTPKPRRVSTRFEPKLDFDALGLGGSSSDSRSALTTLGQSVTTSSKRSSSGSQQQQQPFVSKFAGTVDGTRRLCRAHGSLVGIGTVWRCD